MQNESLILLFVDATLNKEKPSRTYRICQAYLEQFQLTHPQYQIRHLILSDEELMPVKLADIEERQELVQTGNLNHPALRYAAEFARADAVLIGAPYWELSFPAVLKIYIERISVCGITFCYTENGSKGLCRASRLTYITSSGGFLGPYDLGTQYLHGLCEVLLGVPKFDAVSAQGLDIDGADVDGILANACKQAKELGGNIISKEETK